MEQTRRELLSSFNPIVDLTGSDSFGVCGGGVGFDVVGEPDEVALEAVFNVGGEDEFVVLVGVNDKFGGDAKTFQCSVYLLAGEDGDVDVDIAAEEESGSGDFGGVAEPGDAIPDGGRGSLQMAFSRLYRANDAVEGGGKWTSGKSTSGRSTNNKNCPCR